MAEGIQGITPYHAKYFAWELTRRRAASEDDRLSQSLFDASVDLNPHQVEAALFALNNPLSKGVVLAVEVGLGKHPKPAPPAAALCQTHASQGRAGVRALHPAPCADYAVCTQRGRANAVRAHLGLPAARWKSACTRPAAPRRCSPSAGQ